MFEIPDYLRMAMLGLVVTLAEHNRSAITEITIFSYYCEGLCNVWVTDENSVRFGPTREKKMDETDHLLSIHIGVLQSGRVPPTTGGIDTNI